MADRVSVQKDAWPILKNEAECLLRIAEKRYMDNTDRPFWWNEEPRWHLYKTIDQISIASYHYRNGNIELYEINMADASNHFLMAISIVTDNEKKGCHPVMKKEEL